MIAYAAERLTHWLKKYVPMTDNEFEVYQYAFDIALYTVLSTLGLLFIGVALGALFPTILCIALFYTNQTFGGGYHANSHIGCFMTMAAGLLAYLFLLSLQPQAELCYVLAIFSLGILMIKPLVLHKNKRYLENKRKELIARSRLVVLIEIASFVLLLFVGDIHLLASCSLSLFVCATSRIVGLIIGKKHF